MLNVLIGNDFWGAGNFGDDLMLAGFLSWQSKQQAEWRVSILCAHDIEAMRARFPTLNWIAAHESTREEAIRSADVWLGLGGAVFQSDSGPWLLDRLAEDMRCAARHGIPTFLVGVGLNNIEALATEQAHAIYQLATQIWVRDAQCLAAMRVAGFSEGKLHLGADVAHLAFAERARPEPLSGLASCLAVETGLSEPTSLFNALTAYEPQSTWLCQEVRALAGCEMVLQRLIPAHLKSAFDASCLDYQTTTLANVVAEFQRFEVLLTSRYHMTIAGAWAGSRVAVYDRNAKLTGVRQELGLFECSDLSSQAAVTQALRNAQVANPQTLFLCAARAKQMLDQFASAVNAIRPKRETAMSQDALPRSESRKPAATQAASSQPEGQE